MGSVFGGGGGTVAPPPPPGKTTAEIAQARLDAERRNANARGRKSTLLGGGIDQENVQIKTLLGK